MQPRQAGNTGSTGGGGPRRSLMNPFVALSAPYQQPQAQPQQQQQHHHHHQEQQPPTGFQYPTAPTRSYPQQQQPMPDRYWQPSTMDAPMFGRQSSHGASMDLVFNDIVTSSAVGASRSGSESAETQDMSVASSFDVGSIQDGNAGSSEEKTAHQSSTATTAITMHSKPRAQTQVAIPSSSVTVAKKAGADSNDDMAATRHLVEAAYQRITRPQDDADLTQRKIESKGEKCQFVSCPNRARVAQAYGNFCNRHVIVAPCGFPGCREKAVEQAAMCDKHLELGKDALYKILSSRPQNVPVCRQPGCFKNDQGRGYCRGHEKLLMATGRLPPHINKRRLNSAYTMCSYPDCNKHSQRHHLCRTHGNLLQAQAKEKAARPDATEDWKEILDKMEKDMRRCTHENCTKNSQRDRLCTLHYYEKHNLQKDGSVSAPGGAGAEDNFELKLPANENSSDNDLRAVERTRCSAAGCGNLSYAAGLCVEHVKQSQSQLQFSDTFQPGESAAVLAASDQNESKQSLANLSYKQQTSNIMGATSLATTKCSNPMCSRNSYGRDYCESCQGIFSPLVVSVNDIPLGSTSYPVGLQAETHQAGAVGRSLPCRVKACGRDSTRGGLCETHFHAFQTGSLSIDQLSLDSQLKQEQELADAAVAAAATLTKQTSPKVKKYFCRASNCGKQAQKQGMCKRHFRLQMDNAVETSKLVLIPEDERGSFVASVESSRFSRAPRECRFPGCHESPESGFPLCLMHSKATYCWQPGCESLVEYPTFCEYHAFRRQCAFEGCMYGTEKDRSGCAGHALARRCRHDYCDKFSAGSNSDWCRIHQISCQESPCALCQLHLLSVGGFAAGGDENSSRGRFNANFNIPPPLPRGMPGGSYGGGSSPM